MNRNCPITAFDAHSVVRLVATVCGFVPVGRISPPLGFARTGSVLDNGFPVFDFPLPERCICAAPGTSYLYL